MNFEISLRSLLRVTAATMIAWALSVLELFKAYMPPPGFEGRGPVGFVALVISVSRLGRTQARAFISRCLVHKRFLSDHFAPLYGV